MLKSIKVMGNQQPRPKGKVQRLSLLREYTKVGGSGQTQTDEAVGQDIVCA